MDIVESLFKNKININKLYLKFDMRDLRKLETNISREYHEEIKHPIKQQNKSLTPFYDENITNKLKDTELTYKYYEIEMKHATGFSSTSQGTLR